MSLLLKQNPLVSQLVLYDVVNTAGVAADISHIETPAQVSAGLIIINYYYPQLINQVTSFQGDEQLGEALKGCDVVLIPAGVPRKPGYHSNFIIFNPLLTYEHTRSQV